MIVDCAVYRDGTRVPVDGDADDVAAALEAASHTDDFVWLGLHEPGQDEMDEVATMFGLHQLAAEDAVRAHQRPKLERYDRRLALLGAQDAVVRR
ncbi:MAG: CorA family divalent cation transporter [Nocardioidaceae bacterium]